MVQYSIINKGLLFNGKICKSRGCGDFKILVYNNSKRILIQFVESGTTLYSQASHIRRGNVKDPYHPSVLGVGFIGEGVYKLHSKVGSKWAGMLTRCYCKKYHSEKPTYVDCEVSEEWQNLQNFGKWYDSTYPLDGESYELDKDFKVLGNKLYSEDTCIWLPRKINSFFIRCSGGTSGVTYRNGKYIARVSGYSLGESSCINMGSYNSESLVLDAYKKGKLRIAKNLLDLYKDKIPKIVEENIYTYINSKEV